MDSLPNQHAQDDDGVSELDAEPTAPLPSIGLKALTGSPMLELETELYKLRAVRHIEEKSIDQPYKWMQLGHLLNPSTASLSSKSSDSGDHDIAPSKAPGFKIVTPLFLEPARKTKTKCGCNCNSSCDCDCSCVKHCYCSSRKNQPCDDNCRKNDKGRNLIISIDGTSNQFGSNVSHFVVVPPITDIESY